MKKIVMQNLHQAKLEGQMTRIKKRMVKMVMIKKRLIVMRLA